MKPEYFLESIIKIQYNPKVISSIISMILFIILILIISILFITKEK